METQRREVLQGFQSACMLQPILTLQPPCRECSYLLDAPAPGGAAASAAPVLRSVPSSRSEVFKDRQLSPVQVRAGCKVATGGAVCAHWHRSCFDTWRASGSQRYDSLAFCSQDTYCPRAPAREDSRPPPCLAYAPAEAQPHAVPEGRCRGARGAGSPEGEMRCSAALRSGRGTLSVNCEVAICLVSVGGSMHAARCLPPSLHAHCRCRTPLGRSPSRRCWQSRAWMRSCSRRCCTACCCWTAAPRAAAVATAMDLGMEALCLLGTPSSACACLCSRRGGMAPAQVGLGHVATCAFQHPLCAPWPGYPRAHLHCSFLD